MRKRFTFKLMLGVWAISLAACAAPQVTPVTPQWPAGPETQVQVHINPLNISSPCAQTFITHPLNHLTQVHGEEVIRFETNGAGVAIGDLNDDQLLDIVLANLKGPATILWNQGQLKFETEILTDQNTRAVNLVDVEGDGRLDIVFTHIASGLSYWRNLEHGAPPGNRASFTRGSLPKVFKPAHSMAWGDVDADGDLDLVTGSYDAELGLQGNSFLFSDGAGIYYYERAGAGFIPSRLASASQALVIALFDFNHDQRLDILVGNDFDTPDFAWAQTASGWQSAEPFAVTARHTMSFDWGDVDNNGAVELFSTDMKPMAFDVDTMVTWLPMMATMKEDRAFGSNQTTANVLQVRDATGRYKDQAITRGVDAAGWGWSGKFGDLDQDGYLDLYVVNGMMDADLLDYLPNQELVEENIAFRNLQDGSFLLAPEWGLNSTASGRGLSLADLDNDGDLDAVVNNLRAPAQLFENRLCAGSSLQAELRWPASANRYALGAQLILHTSAGSYLRDVRAASGYLSGDPPRVHFGFPSEADLQALEIRWPDGATSTISSLTAQSLLTITR